MAISVGDRLPDAMLLKIGEKGPEAVSVASLTKGRKIVMFGLPGAYTRTCSAAHVPSFIRTKPQFDAKGVDAIVCVSVNDPFVMMAWGKDTGATAAGIEMLADSSAEFTKAIGMAFTAPPAGFFDRCKRFAAVIEDGVVTAVNEETAAGACDLTAGEAMLEKV